MFENKRIRYGLIGLAVLIIFLAILIPSVTLRSAPNPHPQEEVLPPPTLIEVKPDLMEKVRQALKETPLIDGHNDLPYQYYKQVGNHINLLDISKNLGNKTHTDIPRMREGMMGGQFFAAYSGCETQYKDAVEFGMMQTDVVRRMVKKYPNDFSLAGTAQDIRDAHKSGKMGILVGLEGGHMINSNLAMLRLYYDLGVRYMTLTHNCQTPWADAAYSDNAHPDTKHDNKIEKVAHNGLTDFGKEVLAEMNRIGMLVDISHVSEEVMLDSLKHTKAPVIFSHSSVYGLCKHRRNVKDHVLKKLKENKGILMLNFWSKVLVCTEDYKKASLQDVIEQLNYVRDLIGVDYVGMGADYDGVGDVPIGLEDVTKYPVLFAKLLEDEKWSVEDIKKIAGENILRVMSDAEKVSKQLENNDPIDETLDYLNFAKERTNCSCTTIKDVTKKET